MKKRYLMIPAFSLSALLVGCGEKKTAAADDHGHPHKEGEAHGHPHTEAKAEDDHDHGDEVALGKFMAGKLEIEAAQGHGMVEAGKEGHLIIKLPYKDDGASIVRAWIGTEDRTLSAVGKGEYAPSHDDYDIHATAPSPLPADTKWWVEVEKPDGTKLVGSIVPKM
jgi:ABC-type Zn2+ transport system substrate-binding protein/surface adhesin